MGHLWIEEDNITIPHRNGNPNGWETKILQHNVIRISVAVHGHRA
jgi:hypothetical protein